MKQSGFSPIIVVVAVVILILAIGALYLFLRCDSSAAVIQPNPQKSIKSTKVDPSNKTSIDIPITESELKEIQVDTPVVKAKPADQKSVIDEDGGVAYINETFQFSVKHPKDYIFDEKIRNYYNIDSSEDPNELVYTYTLSNPQLAPTGGLPGDKIVVTIYNKGYEPLLQQDRGSTETKRKLGGIETKKTYSNEGKLITVGPVTHKENTYTIHYEMPSALSNQEFFNAVLDSFKFTD